MKQFDVRFNQEQLGNIAVFLERVELKGTTEAVALASIANAVGKAKEVEEDGDKDKSVQPK